MKESTRFRLPGKESTRSRPGKESARFVPTKSRNTRLELITSGKLKGAQITVRPRSSDPIHIVSYYKKLVTTSWTYSKYNIHTKMSFISSSSYCISKKFLPITYSILPYKMDQDFSDSNLLWARLLGHTAVQWSRGIYL